MTDQPKAPRGNVQCEHCGSIFVAGEYAEHVRHSWHPSHDRHRAMHVDVKGNVTFEKGPRRG